METGGNPWVYPGGGSWRAAWQTKAPANPAKQKQGEFSGKNDNRPSGEDGKIASSKTGKNGFGTGKTIFSIDNFAPCRLYCYLLQGFAPKGEGILMLRTYQPKKIHRKKEHGFRKRNEHEKRKKSACSQKSERQSPFNSTQLPATTFLVFLFMTRPPAETGGLSAGS